MANEVLDLTRIEQWRFRPWEISRMWNKQDSVGNQRGTTEEQIQTADAI